jgi:hypothetical protein
MEEFAMDQNTMQTFGNASDVMQRNAHGFWQKQSELLDNMQVFANGWFERRHAGTRAAWEASGRMCSATTPMECLGEYQKWLSGAVERLVADGLACQRGLGALTEGIAPSLVPSATQEPAYETRQETTPAAA